MLTESFTVPKSEYDITLLTQNYESTRETVRRLSSWLPPVLIESPEDTTPTATMSVSFAPQQPFDSNALALHNTHILSSTPQYPGSASSSQLTAPSPSAPSSLLFTSSSAPASVTSHTPSSNVSPFPESRSNISSPVPENSPPPNTLRSPTESAALIFAHSAFNAAWIHLNATADVLPLSAPFQSPFLEPQTLSQRALSLSPPPNPFAAPSPSSSGSSHYSHSPPYSHASPVTQSPVSQPPWQVPDPWNLQTGPRTLNSAREIAELARMAYFDEPVFEELDMMIGVSVTYLSMI